MSEHYTRNTVTCTVFCPKCYRVTLHRVMGGRRGPCVVCLEKLEKEREQRVDEPTQATQPGLFGDWKWR